ncbi:Ground region domain containing protein [Aphelenchoides fujianensis]|nr:Ground region domain containing protein [Aphelenchoides fujianensis]
MINSRVLVCFVLLSTLLVLSVDGCGFPMGGGGGGGCGGCAPMCGCGRKKRSVIEPQIRTEESAPCPQAAWESIIKENIGEDVNTSKYAVQGALFKEYETKFLITCAKSEDKHHLQFVTNGEGYCSAGNERIWCAAVVLQA